MLIILILQSFAKLLNKNLHLLLVFYMIFTDIGNLLFIDEHKTIHMKNILLQKGLLFLSIMFLSFSQKVNGQVILYEGFDYTVPGYIGGNGNQGATSNNWTTHSVTAGQTTTVDLLAGNLTYPGLLTSTGNKVLLFGNANLTSRDVNRAFSSTNTILYFSALINIVDNSQITITKIISCILARLQVLQ